MTFGKSPFGNLSGHRPPRPLARRGLKSSQISCVEENTSLWRDSQHNFLTTETEHQTTEWKDRIKQQSRIIIMATFDIAQVDGGTYEHYN